MALCSYKKITQNDTREIKFNGFSDHIIEDDMAKYLKDLAYNYC